MVAKKGKKTHSSQPTVTRISAGNKSAKPRKSTTKPAATQRQKADIADTRGTPLTYFRGAWRELKLVRWPTRRATWSLTGAVLAFSAFFVGFILLIDAFFKYLFQLILK